MEVTGRLISINEVAVNPETFEKIYSNATIKLPSVDKSKIKEGDKVWMEVTCIKDSYGQISPNINNYFKYVAHFPQSQPKQEQNCNCENPRPKFKVDNEGIGFTNYCKHCRGKISQEKMEEYLKETLPKKPDNPEVKVPEKLGITGKEQMTESEFLLELNSRIIRDEKKVNEIIEYLEKKE